MKARINPIMMNKYHIIINHDVIDVTIHFYEGKWCPIASSRDRVSEETLHKARKAAMWLFNRIKGFRYPNSPLYNIEYDYKAKSLTLYGGHNDWAFVPDKGNKVHYTGTEKGESADWKDITKVAGVFINNLFPPRKKAYREEN
jgi:hypothetical protein